MQLYAVQIAKLLRGDFIMSILPTITSVIMSVVMIFLSFFGVTLWGPSERAANEALSDKATVNSAVEYYNKIVEAAEKYNCIEEYKSETLSFVTKPYSKEVTDYITANSDDYNSDEIIVKNTGRDNYVEQYLIQADKVKSYSLTTENDITTLSFTFESTYVFNVDYKAIPELEMSYYEPHVSLKLDKDNKILSLNVEYLNELTDSWTDSNDNEIKVKWKDKNNDTFDFYKDGKYQIIKD